MRVLTDDGGSGAGGRLRSPGVLARAARSARGGMTDPPTPPRQSRGARLDVSDIPKIKRIVVHIGTEKTGTTTIQGFLSLNRRELQQEGVLYPSFSGKRGGSQWGFVAAVHERPWKHGFGVNLGIVDRQSADAYCAQLISAVDHEIRESCCHSLLISSEHFHSRLNSLNSIAKLKQFLGRWSDDVRIVLFIRRQDRMAVSRYSTKLKSGKVKLGKMKGPFHLDSIRSRKYYDYDLIYSEWAHVFGVENVTVLVYERCVQASDGLLGNFCSVCGLSFYGKSIPKNINLSLSESGIELLLMLNAVWPVDKGRKSSALRARLVALIGDRYAGRCDLVTRREAEYFYDNFAEGNTRLANRLFAGGNQALFDVDFSQYPPQIATRTALDRRGGVLIGGRIVRLICLLMRQGLSPIRGVSAWVSGARTRLGLLCGRGRR
jgi:hypothetical protein